ncbi:GNAT family N-acetyltransferase [Paenibacillus eucommiae]|uniref:GNAT superfamily N-acetyltransferase n=1 Tax=Paenibacillus eucommiae TaxID=1355755 RepID=A0ABS4J802_9BACL|nr:GNAT family N-acetyltransferase [Paenibacillus eucommiae]MBP1995974.1 GNAT superfamily N-acetyltransferase [Paenibacillus eucommiae]
MKFVSLSEAYIGPLLELWNRELGEQFPMRERLLRQNCFEDVNLLEAGSWLAVDESAGNELRGFVVSKKWTDRREGIEFPEDTGWIQALLVDSRYRGRGIGSDLIDLAEQALKEQGASKIELGNDLHRRMFPGIPLPNIEAVRWFERRGYKDFATITDLLRIYEEAESMELPALEGVTIRFVHAAERERIESFLHKHFPGRWDYLTRQYWEHGGTGREYMIMEQGDELIGFCRVNDSHSPLLTQNIYWAPLFADELGGLGPLGIDPAFRGKGYGAAIVQAGIAMLRQRGIRSIVIDATQIADFYEKLGYRIWRKYGMYRKLL